MDGNVIDWLHTEPIIDLANQTIDVCETLMVWNIGKHGYIGTWILRIYRKNVSKMKIIQNSWKYLENSKKMIK